MFLCLRCSFSVCACVVFVVVGVLCCSFFLNLFSFALMCLCCGVCCVRVVVVRMVVVVGCGWCGLLYRGNTKNTTSNMVVVVGLVCLFFCVLVFICFSFGLCLGLLFVFVVALLFWCWFVLCLCVVLFVLWCLFCLCCCCSCSCCLLLLVWFVVSENPKHKHTCCWFGMFVFNLLCCFVCGFLWVGVWA